jgi:hypothetical protein
MNHRALVGLLAASLIVTVLTGRSSRAGQESQASERAVLEGFSALEYLLGGWKGQGVPKNDPANRFRGWTETHSWSWIFQKGEPVALSLRVEGGHVLASAKLTYDRARKLYRLDGVTPPPGSGPIQLEGKFDSTGKLLVLESVGKSPKNPGTIRLSIRPNANLIRYTIREERREPGGIQFSPFIEVGLTKEGESFASGASAAERAKCIVTGAASTMSVAYQGNSYPVCCTGCRDEFLETPEKYIHKASLLLKVETGKPKPDKPSTSRVSRSEDAFASDVSEPDGKPDARSGRAPAADPVTTADADKAPARSASADSKQRTRRTKDARAVSKDVTRAASLLQIAQNLEKNGRAAPALAYYRRIVKDYPNTPAAKTAAERVKALGGR